MRPPVSVPDKLPPPLKIHPGSRASSRGGAILMDRISAGEWVFPAVPGPAGNDSRNSYTHLLPPMAIQTNHLSGRPSTRDPVDCRGRGRHGPPASRPACTCPGASCPRPHRVLIGSDSRAAITGQTLAHRDSLLRLLKGSRLSCPDGRTERLLWEV